MDTFSDAMFVFIVSRLEQDGIAGESEAGNSESFVEHCFVLFCFFLIIIELIQGFF